MANGATAGPAAPLNPFSILPVFTGSFPGLPFKATLPATSTSITVTNDPITGKSASFFSILAIACAEQLNMDIISVDSALVYRDMDIGSAKPDAATMLRAPHKLVDILDPAEAYSAGQFCDDALAEMASSTAAGRIPCLAGGTMLYFNALQKGMADLPDSDPEVRQRLYEQSEKIGMQGMHDRLADVDRDSAQRLHPNHPSQTIRTREVC